MTGLLGYTVVDEAESRIRAGGERRRAGQDDRRRASRGRRAGDERPRHRASRRDGDRQRGRAAAPARGADSLRLQGHRGPRSLLLHSRSTSASRAACCSRWRRSAPGFTVDEERRDARARLKLPPWEEPNRADIEPARAGSATGEVVTYATASPFRSPERFAPHRVGVANPNLRGRGFQPSQHATKERDAAILEQDPAWERDAVAALGTDDREVVQSHPLPVLPRESGLSAPPWAGGDVRRLSRRFRKPHPAGFQGAGSALQLNRALNPALVGLGSCIVQRPGRYATRLSYRAPYAEGHDPFMGQPERINTAGYLAGGTPFGPFTSRNLTPRANGRPAEPDVRTVSRGPEEGHRLQESTPANLAAAAGHAVAGLRQDDLAGHPGDVRVSQRHSQPSHSSSADADSVMPRGTQPLPAASHRFPGPAREVPAAFTSPPRFGR